MDNKYAHMLRKKLDKKIIRLVKPYGMSVDEYIINCNLNQFNPSVENGAYLHWLITASGDIDIQEKVHDAIIKALSKKYLLDPDDEMQRSYFHDAIVDMLLKDKSFTIGIFEAVLKNYDEDDETFKFCKKLNKSTGLTSVKYFG